MVLQITCFFLWGLLWAIFFMTDGFDFGVGILYPFLAKSDLDKKMMISTVGPILSGNEVWLIAAIGFTFAAFPIFYSVMFSSLYSPLMIILFALIVRGISLEFRGKIRNKVWRKIWDSLIFISSLLPALLFGLIFSNIFKGIPVGEKGIYYGSFMTLINPYSVLGSITFACLFIMHGNLWLALKTSETLRYKSESIAIRVWFVTVLSTATFLLVTIKFTDIYNNYTQHPILLFIILVIIATMFKIKHFLIMKKYFASWLASSGLILGFIFLFIIGLFPRLLKSSIDSVFDITIYNSSSSPLALKIMLLTVIIFIPIVLGYQIWTYNLFKERIKIEDLTSKKTRKDTNFYSH